MKRKYLLHIKQQENFWHRKFTAHINIYNMTLQKGD